MGSEYLNNGTFTEIIEQFQGCKRAKSRYEFILEDLRSAQNGKDVVRKNMLDAYEREYAACCSQYSQCQEKLISAFHLLAQNIANYTRYHGVDVDDAIQEGVLICMEKVDLFDRRKGKAFNFMTTCIHHHLKQQWRSARNYTELKKKYHNHIQGTAGNTIIRNGKEKFARNHHEPSDWESA